MTRYAAYVTESGEGVVIDTVADRIVASDLTVSHARRIANSLNRALAAGTVEKVEP